jgi:uroporphyrinogen-III synthase
MKLFISKSEQDLGELSAFCQLYGIEFQAQSLIDTSPIPFTLPEKFDAIFFASPRAVDYFLTNEAIPSGVKVACAGDQTRKRLLQNGLTPDFVSSKSAHPEHSAKDFKRSNLLFPILQH